MLPSDLPTVLLPAPFPKPDLRAMEAVFDLRHLYDAQDKPRFLRENGPDVRGIATRGTIGADATLIQACPALEIISVYGVGYDAVDLMAANAQGVRVTNTPDVLTEDVADLGVGMLLAFMRNIPMAQTWVRDGSWAGKGLFPLQNRVFGQRVGILGMGRIGRAVARRLHGFDMQISYCDLRPVADQPGWSFLPTAEALAQNVDILFVTLAASDATRHIVNAQVLNALGAKGVVINISRASNIDEDALINALHDKRIRGAALDVFAGEPKIDPRYLGLDNVLLQPHHASGTHETRAAMGQLMRDNLTAHFAGQPLLSPVN